MPAPSWAKFDVRQAVKIVGRRHDHNESNSRFCPLSEIAVKPLTTRVNICSSGNIMR
jgi:hypothetical protein